MPKALHDELKREAEQKGLTGKMKNAYIFGTMYEIEKKKFHKK